MKKPLSSLALRLISSAILIPIVMVLVAVGEWFFIGFVAACIAVAFLEWLNITKNMTIAFATKTLLAFAGLSYLSFSLFEMASLREQNNGLLWTVVFMLCIWASDSVAYLFGKTIGGKKMSPTISPNKTWSGYAGALIGPAIILTSVHFCTPIGGTILESSIFGLAVGITGQSGDLMISAMKRKAGLKDTGSIIPGHGGILDRIDALLLALPVFLAWVTFVTW